MYAIRSYYEALAGARGELVDVAREHLFPRSALASHQDRGIARGDRLRQLESLPERGARPDRRNHVALPRPIDLLLELDVLPLHPTDVERAPEDSYNFV